MKKLSLVAVTAALVNASAASAVGPALLQPGMLHSAAMTAPSFGGFPAMPKLAATGTLAGLSASSPMGALPGLATIRKAIPLMNTIHSGPTKSAMSECDPEDVNCQPPPPGLLQDPVYWVNYYGITYPTQVAGYATFLGLFVANGTIANYNYNISNHPCDLPCSVLIQGGEQFAFDEINQIILPASNIPVPRPKTEWLTQFGL